MYKYGDESVRLWQETGEINWCPQENSKIADFYKDKNVFVTGATGFLGKLLVEKLLRACPEINTVYILVRPKKGDNELSRIDKLYSDPIFSPLSKIFPKFQHKISVIKGDVSLPGLGIKSDDRAILTEQVNVIFHIAATVRFDEKLTLATAINVRATRDLLQIAKECKKLDSFLHVSTAYTYCNQETIDEVFYKPPITAEQLIQLVEETPEKVLLENTQKIVGNWPNTYTFTKAIAENAVKEYSQNLPVCLIRPAVVVATYKEPLRSWIDNLYGATGIAVGAGTGLLKTMHCDEEKSAELVPGDYVINSMIAAAYKTAMDNNRNQISVYNYVSSVENRQNWKQFMEKSRTWGEEIPTIRCVWYYCLFLTRYYWVNYAYSIFLHSLPAMIMDFGMMLTGQSPIMMKIYKKINKFESVIAHFATNEWKFYNDNTQALWNYLSEPDRKMFPFSMKELDWDEYHKTHLLGLRIHLVKDDLSTLPEARKKWRRFYIANNVVKTLFYSFILYMVYLLLSKIF